MTQKKISSKFLRVSRIGVQSFVGLVSSLASIVAGFFCQILIRLADFGLFQAGFWPHIKLCIYWKSCDRRNVRFILRVQEG